MADTTNTPDPKSVATRPPGTPDFEALSQNAAKLIEEASKVALAYLAPRAEGPPKPDRGGDIADMVKTLGRVAESWMADPARTAEAQGAFTHQFTDLWSRTLRRANGEVVEPLVVPSSSDVRFKDPDWAENPAFDFIKQAYLLTARWAQDMVAQADGIDEHTRMKAAFYMRQIASAVSPTNFLATNPDVLRSTLQENGANLVRGMKMLAEDIDAGRGELRVRQTDASQFEVGVNIATTPGKVVFRNELIELIQYAPSTPKVLARPLLIVPPWINKFYILDLNPEKSFIRWAVEQGLTVFCISWVNPDERHADLGFPEYMKDGLFAAVEVVKAITRQKEIAAIGYCIGGTLLSIGLAHMATTGDASIASATFFTAQVDFALAGDLKVFIDEEQIAGIEEQMRACGYLHGRHMANSFNMLRPNDLIWPYVVNNYLKGQTPYPFDLLYWNADSTRMSAANQSFYMRKLYLENALSRGQVVIDEVPIDLNAIKIPIYELATKEDHIAPARSVFLGSRGFGGPVEYVLAGSGHIAGVVNPPAKNKYQYWTGKPADTFDGWFENAASHPGSWWPHWFAWVEAQAPALVKARPPGSRRYKPITNAPGSYVRVKS